MLHFKVWKHLSTVQNEVKAVANIHITMYKKMTAPAGLSEEQQIQHTIAAVIELAGEDIKFTGGNDDALGRASNWCDPIFEKAVLHALYIGKNKVATQSPECKVMYGAEVPKAWNGTCCHSSEFIFFFQSSLAVLFEQMVCSFLGWKDGYKKDVPFVHADFNEIYRNMLDNISMLEKDPYQRMKLTETRREWARIGM